MPEVHYFTVTEIREVKVRATTLMEAAEVANAILEGMVVEGDMSEVNVTVPVRQKELVIREDY